MLRDGSEGSTIVGVHDQEKRTAGERVQVTRVKADGRKEKKTVQFCDLFPLFSRAYQLVS